MERYKIVTGAANGEGFAKWVMLEGRVGSGSVEITAKNIPDVKTWGELQGEWQIFQHHSHKCLFCAE